jgi:hypothetical protein
LREEACCRRTSDRSHETTCQSPTEALPLSRPLGDKDDVDEMTDCRTDANSDDSVVFEGAETTKRS